MKILSTPRMERCIGGHSSSLRTNKECEIAQQTIEAIKKAKGWRRDE